MHLIGSYSSCLFQLSLRNKKLLDILIGTEYITEKFIKNVLKDPNTFPAHTSYNSFILLVDKKLIPQNVIIQLFGYSIFHDYKKAIYLFDYIKNNYTTYRFTKVLLRAYITHGIKTGKLKWSHCLHIFSKYNMKPSRIMLGTTYYYGKKRNMMRRLFHKVYGERFKCTKCLIRMKCTELCPRIIK